MIEKLITFKNATKSITESFSLNICTRLSILFYVVKSSQQLVLAAKDH